MAENDAAVHWKATSFAFSSRYQKLHLNSEIPTFLVGFLGRCEVDRPEEVSKASYRSNLVSEICRRIRMQKRPPRRVELSISSHGIEMVDERTGSEELLPIYLINRGMTDIEKPRVFSFVSQNVRTKRLECFAFVSNKGKTSWAMTLSLKRSFEVAFEAWQMEQRRKNKFQDARLLELAEDLLKNREDSPSEKGKIDDEQLTKKVDIVSCIDYSPRTTWTKFEEDLMEKPTRRFPMNKTRASQRRMPSVREIVGQPAVDSMFRQRQKLVSHASVFDVGDNEGLRKAVEDEDVQIMSLTGMSNNDRKKGNCNIDDFMK